MQARKLGVLLALGASCGGGISMQEFEELLCRDDSGCGGSYVCVGFGQGKCEPGCRLQSSVSTCGPGHFCQSVDNPEEPTLGRCEAGCREHGDCGDERYVCVGANLAESVAGSCQPKGCTKENEEADCGKGRLCVDGRCVHGCLKDSDCLSKDYICENNTCQPGCRVGNDSTCSKSGYICKGDKTTPEAPGKCEPGCRVGPAGDKACATQRAGYICLDGTCQPGCYVGPDGKLDENCGPGHICKTKDNSTTSGTLGTCELGCRVGNDSTCVTSGYICNGTVPNTPGTCELGCRSDPDCIKDYICEDKTCRPGCRVGPEGNLDENCGNGYICKTDGNNIDRNTPGICEFGCRVGDSGNEACGKGYLCKGTAPIGKCQPGCDDKNSCPDKQTCVNGSCHVVECYVPDGANTQNCTGSNQICVGLTPAIGSPGICWTSCTAATATKNCKTGQSCKALNGTLVSGSTEGLCMNNN